MGQCYKLGFITADIDEQPVENVVISNPGPAKDIIIYMTNKCIQNT